MYFLAKKNKIKTKRLRTQGHFYLGVCPQVVFDFLTQHSLHSYILVICQEGSWEQLIVCNFEKICRKPDEELKGTLVGLREAPGLIPVSLLPDQKP